MNTPIELTAPASEDHLSNMKINQSNNGFSAVQESSRTSKTRKNVTFAQYSEQHIFLCSSYRLRHSYKRSDIRLMKNEVLKDASRIYDLISRHPQTQNGIASIISLGVKQEDLVGLEHLIGPESARGRTSNGRRVHKDAVLQAQEIYRREALSSEVATLKLAKVASASSSRHAMKARNKAKMSLEAKRPSPDKTSSRLSRVEAHLSLNVEKSESTEEIMTPQRAMVNGRTNATSKARKTAARAA